MPQGILPLIPRDATQISGLVKDIREARQSKRLMLNMTLFAESVGALIQLFEHLNKAELKYPGSEMQLVYKLGGYPSPIDGLWTRD